jgi:hypothetical protein
MAVSLYRKIDVNLIIHHWAAPQGLALLDA